MASTFTFYNTLFTNLNSNLATYWQDVATNMATAITPVATTLITIYVILWGWSMIRGVISEPITDGVSRILRLAIIVGIALNVGQYNTYLADMLWNSPDALATIVAPSYSSDTTNMQYLDTLMGQFYDMGTIFTDAADQNSIAGIPNPSLWITGMCINATGLIVTGYAAFLLILAKMGLAILLGIGPIFILLTVFEPTKRFFDAWLGQSVNFVFLALLTAAAIKLIITLVQSYIVDPATVAVVTETPSINQALPAIGYSIVGFLVMMQLPSTASRLRLAFSISFQRPPLYILR